MATHESVGTLAEEAAKLISALQGWAADHAEGPDDPARPDDPERYADEHATGQHLSAECRYCPLCNLARVARAAGPDVREHLTSAALSMTLALKGLLEGLDREPARSRREPVEKIDLLED